MAWHWDKTVRRIADGKRVPLEPDNRALIAFACFVLAAAVVAALVLREIGGSVMATTVVEERERSLTYVVCAAGASVGVGVGLALFVWWVGRGAARSALDWLLDRTLRGRPH